MSRRTRAHAAAAATACLAALMSPAGLGAQNAAAPRSIELEAADGVTVYGSVYGDPAAARALILLFHQGGGNARAEYDAIAPRLVDAGYAAIAIDQRTGGTVLGGTNRTASALGGEPTYCEAYPDLVAALAHARTLAGGRPIVAWGSSYSGALVLRLGGEHRDLAGILAFSPASGEAMGDCEAGRFVSAVRVPALVLRPARELELERARTGWEAFAAAGFERFVATPGVHGSSMLNPARVDGDVADAWRAVLEFIDRVTRGR